MLLDVSQGVLSEQGLPGPFGNRNQVPQPPAASCLARLHAKGCSCSTQSPAPIRTAALRHPTHALLNAPFAILRAIAATEIEAYEQALQSALAELRRVRGVEEARLAGRVEDATRRFEQQLAGLQQQYLAEVGPGGMAPGEGRRGGDYRVKGRPLLGRMAEVWTAGRGASG